LTFGWLVGEVVRRVSGQSLGEFVRTEIAEPLGLDLWLGLPEEIEPRVAVMGQADPQPGDEPPRLTVVAATEPESVQARLLLNTGGYLEGGFNTREAHAAELGAVGAITNARALAGMYAPLACGGGQLVDGAALARMSTTVSAGRDAMGLANSRFTYGFVPSVDNRHEPPGERDSMILSADAFGHPGLGGGLGFASPANRMSFGYTMNAMGPSTLLTRAARAWSTPSTRRWATRTTTPRCGADRCRMRHALVAGFSHHAPPQEAFRGNRIPGSWNFGSFP
jgi:CubicO group peptidase (beta-lactamase class C family)